MTDSVARQCIDMAAILGVAEPVREEVLRAAVADSTYAHNLLVCRGDQEYLQHLLAHPPHADAAQGAELIGAGTLARRAAESLVRWGKTGFSTVSEERYRKRLEACTECPHLQSPPTTRVALYALAGAAANDRTVCGKCGCVVTVKARRTSETCPDAHPDHADLNRWGDPLVPSEDGRR